MKKIGTLTFHRAKNFGSVLQAYALQRFLEQVADANGVQIDNRIIDITPRAQEQIYALYKKGMHPKTLVKNAVAFRYRRALRKKIEKYDRFIAQRLPLTAPCNEEELPQVADGMDYVLCGSDQIWNVRAGDFEPWFYLDFPTKAKKVSYATSFGPLDIDWDKYDRQKVGDCLADFSTVSVREQASADHVKALCGRDAHIDVDPTLLLTLEDWRAVQSDASYKDGRYILLYCMEPTPAQLRMAKRISKKLDLPVLITKYNNKHDMINTFVKRYDCGPEDFLSLIDHAALVLTSSFHGTVFSAIYQKPFYVFDGAKDRRTSHFLAQTELQGQILPTSGGIENVSLTAPDFTGAQQYLQKARKQAEEYLCDALEF